MHELSTIALQERGFVHTVHGLSFAQQSKEGVFFMETLRYERVGHVGWLRLNRPQKLNSMTVQMWEEMRTLGQELQHDAELRALVVIGEGRSFSTGIDTSQYGGNLLG